MFGRLGLSLIEKAQKEIKEINRQTIFQMSEIKKRNIGRLTERSLKIKKQFIESYNQFLNNSLSTTLLKNKDQILNLKNKLIKELKNELIQRIKEKKNKNYSNYIIYLIKTIKSISLNIDKPPKILILFNNKDYNYFKSNLNTISDLFKNKVEIQNIDNGFIGGFKVLLSDGAISYDYTIDSLINTSSSIIQAEFSRIMAENKIKNIEQDFKNFIQLKQNDTEEYLEKYDQI